MVRRRSICKPIMVLAACCAAYAAGWDRIRSQAQGRVVIPEERQAKVRTVRVLVLANADAVTIQPDRSASLVGIDSSSVSEWPADTPLKVKPSKTGGLKAGRIQFPSGMEMRSGGLVTLFTNRSDQREKLGTFPDALRIVPSANGKISVINLVDVEAYVAGVVSREAWPTFATEALRCQAIAARTYVLNEMQRRRGNWWDVRGNQLSQVYSGTVEGAFADRAKKATDYTEGVVCTWNNDGEPTIFSTFYGAACGGVTQPSTVFGQDDFIEPLKGGITCNYCSEAPPGNFTWGPVRMPVTEALAKLTEAYPRCRKLKGITRFVTVERAPTGRAIRWRIEDAGGNGATVLADTARLALGGMKVRSTDCRVTIDGEHLVFDRGRGFGHGVGLCQWGMQGLARRGWKAGKILRHYFPGCVLTRVQ